MKSFKSVLVIVFLLFTLVLFGSCSASNGTYHKSKGNYVQSRHVQKKSAQIRNGNQWKCNHGKHKTLQQKHNKFLLF